MEDGNPIDVFVSYSSLDRERVRPIVEKLTTSGFHVWWDSRIAPGAGFDSEIQNALDRARCVLVIWSEHSVISEWVINEASEGLEKEILVPVTIDDVRPPIAFRRRQTIDISSNQNEIETIVTAVRGVVSGEFVEIRQTAQPRGNHRVPWFAGWIGVSIILGLAGGAALMKAFLPQSQNPSDALVRASIDLDGYVEWQNFDPNPSLAMSRDGQTIVYVSRWEDGTSALFSRRTDQLQTFEIAGTEDAERPFLSPDGRWVGFFSGDLIRRVPLEGGAPTTVTKLQKRSCCRGASWDEFDEIIFVEGRSGLKAVSIAGGPHRTVSELNIETGEGSHRTPGHVTGHRRLLFSIMYDATGKHEVWSLNLDTGARKYLVDGVRPRYVEPGYLLYAKGAASMPDRSGSLWAAPFDPKKMEITGPTKLIQSGVGGREGNAYAVGVSGSILYLPSQGELVGELVLLDGKGGSRVLDEGPLFENPQFSNDGELIAVGVYETGATPSVRIYEISTGARRQFAEGLQPLWGLDDRSIVYNDLGKGLVRKGTGSDSKPEMLVQHTSVIVPNAWVDEGRTLVYNAASPERVGDVYALTLGGETLHIDGGGATLSSVSPDERWIAVCTWPAGIVVGSFPDMRGRTVADSSGCSPKWSADGTKLYFQKRHKVVAMEVNVGRALAFHSPSIVGDLGNFGIRNQFDVDDGERIVLDRHTHRSPRPAVIMTNWRGNLVAP